ncbi:DUF1365 domain-containing protein [Parendozoicomonas haliclonae]|uniref:DUF1365 domain-containing protein n=1 Tax=Parendozoicomonas haliclonae TaxID=1960125 RepID=A0A1X7AGL8_9GAMM|nr:DUF1365 domain-containing protein [Parendozoicomonas haliclonae]SMA40263.1 hypothetical protein EHSB41UT_01164 [Parendozoicomonas haliclonae]
MNSALYSGVLMHNRLHPKKHRFSYRVTSWLFDLDELEQLNQSLKLFSLNRFNLVSFHTGDHGNWSDSVPRQTLREYVSELLAEQGIAEPKRIALFCYPRILGYTFNPLATFFCYDADNQITAVVYEVTNTFGERHSYVIAEPEGAGQTIRQEVSKKLHVSPFFETAGHAYQFKIKLPEQSVVLGISLFNGAQRVFGAVFSGDRKAISDRQILRQALSLPFMTLKVIGAIHWEALRLWLKGVAIISHKATGRFRWSRGLSLRANNIDTHIHNNHKKPLISSENAMLSGRESSL